MGRKIYQPEIRENSIDLLKILKETISDDVQEFKELNYEEDAIDIISQHLTNEFIKGDISLNEMDISENVIDNIIGEIIFNESIQNLKKEGYLDSFDDDESFFLTKKGKMLGEILMKKEKKNESME